MYGWIRRIEQYRGGLGDPVSVLRVAIDGVDEAPLTRWGAHDATRLGAATVKARHRLGELGVDRDDALVALLDLQPRQRLQAFTMGTAADRPADWQPVEPGDADGEALLAATKAGRLWLNLLRVDQTDAELAHLQARLFAEIVAAGGDVEPGSPRSTLLVSSPGAQVYFHVDAGPNVLWHLRGEKRVFVYPARNERLVPTSLLQDIFAGVRTENLPYDTAFDVLAESVDLVPGDVIAWAQNSPHRVQNVSGLNVSLSCEFASRASRRREYTVLANRFLARDVHLPVRSGRELGPIASSKRLVYRAARWLHIERTSAHYDYVTDLVVDPNSPDGIRRLEAPVRAQFSVT